MANRLESVELPTLAWSTRTLPAPTTRLVGVSAVTPMWSNLLRVLALARAGARVPADDVITPARREAAGAHARQSIERDVPNADRPAVLTGQQTQRPYDRVGACVEPLQPAGHPVVVG